MTNIMRFALGDRTSLANAAIYASGMIVPQRLNRLRLTPCLDSYFGGLGL
jgi:hypothetical protein